MCFKYFNRLMNFSKNVPLGKKFSQFQSMRKYFMHCKESLPQWTHLSRSYVAMLLYLIIPHTFFPGVSFLLRHPFRDLRSLFFLHIPHILCFPSFLPYFKSDFLFEREMYFTQTMLHARIGIIWLQEPRFPTDPCLILHYSSAFQSGCALCTTVISHRTTTSHLSYKDNFCN